MNSKVLKETSLQFGCLTIASMFTMVAILFAAYGDSLIQKQMPIMHQSTVRQLVV